MKVPKLPQLLYSKKNPHDIRVVQHDGDLFRLYRQGFKSVDLIRVGRLIRKSRKKNGMTMEEFQGYLQSFTLYFSLDSLYQIERGEAPFSILTLSSIKIFAEAIKIEYTDLIRPMIREKAAAQPQKLVAKKNPKRPNNAYQIIDGDGIVSVWLAPTQEEARRMFRAEFSGKEIDNFEEYVMAGLVGVYKHD